jgi:hypothetical protein
VKMSNRFSQFPPAGGSGTPRYQKFEASQRRPKPSRARRSIAA